MKNYVHLVSSYPRFASGIIMGLSLNTYLHVILTILEPKSSIPGFLGIFILACLVDIQRLTPRLARSRSAGACNAIVEEQGGITAFKFGF